MLNQAQIISFSRLNVLTSCAEKYRNQYILKLKRLEPMPDSMSVGKFIDQALGSVGSERIVTFDDFLSENGISFVDEKWLHFCKGIYFARRNLHKRIFKGQKVKLQQPVIIELYDRDTGELLLNENDDPISLIGYLDAYNEKKKRIIEIKTVSKFSDEILKEYRLKGQTQLYTIGIMSLYDLKKIPEVEYIFINKPSIRLKKKETEQEFFERMFAAGKEPEISAEIVQYSEKEIEETIIYFYDLVKHNLSAEPCKNRNSCLEYGNKCPYFGYCWKDQRLWK